MAPSGSQRGKDEVSDAARALARDMARDMLEFTRVAWKLTGQVSKIALRAAEDMAGQAEAAWERQRPGRSRGK